jgi:hypothetical protein
LSVTLTNQPAWVTRWYTATEIAPDGHAAIWYVLELELPSSNTLPAANGGDTAGR